MLDQDLDKTGLVEAEIFDLLDLAYSYGAASTVGWVEARLRVLAARLDRGENLSLFAPASGCQMGAASRAEFKRWALEHFPVAGQLIRAE
ncbi:hypothetical protein ACS15_4777 [Ralstonia insidiosa]|uniref:Uncharacterized protein n=2 Tax=Burkholderiaceae TaxID=119060 RepID=A0AAC9FTR3_9RALS|nr:hypothetical protein ACS15_4777 [Ralstonia insidiosa]